MLDNFRLIFGFFSLLTGVVLLYQGGSNEDISQTSAVVGGAVFVSLGFTCLWLAVKDWLEFRKYFRNKGGKQERRT